MSKPETCERNPSDPTPAEIQQRAASIRKQWSKSITHRRRVWIPPTWQPPVILSVEWMLAVTNEFLDAAQRER